MSMAVTMLLADHAVVAEGKLYVNGGGWSVVDASVPAYSIALLVLVPWDRAGRPMVLNLRLIDEDGRSLTDAATGRPAQISATLGVERPPMQPAGVPLDVPLVVGIPAMTLAPRTRYTWLLDIDGETRDDWRVSFRTR